jgi:hypothetical protein
MKALGHLSATVFMNGINCGLNLAIFNHAARLTFPLEVRHHPTGNIPLYGFYHKLINGLAFFGGKGLHLREQFSGQRYVGVAGHGYSIVARFTVILQPSSRQYLPQSVRSTVQTAEISDA